MRSILATVEEALQSNSRCRCRQGQARRILGLQQNCLWTFDPESVPFMSESTVPAFLLSALLTILRALTSQAGPAAVK
jgi:hypothetical protein